MQVNYLGLLGATAFFWRRPRMVHPGEYFVVDWQPIDSAPFGEDLQLSVIEGDEVHFLVFPCRRTTEGWLHGLTNKPVPVRPTHWRLFDFGNG